MLTLVTLSSSIQAPLPQVPYVKVAFLHVLIIIKTTQHFVWKEEERFIKYLF